jgi:hypothetical protein
VPAQNPNSIPPLFEQKSTPPPPEKVEVEAKTSITTLSNLSIRRINCKEEFERSLVEIITSMKANSPLEQVSVTKLSAALQIVCGETANSVVKKLKLGANFTKFLQSCSTFTIEKAGPNAEVALTKNSFPEIKSPNDLEQ